MFLRTRLRNIGPVLVLYFAVDVGPVYANHAEIDFCSRTGQCDLLSVSDVAPAKLCTRTTDLPPPWGMPFAKIKLRMMFAEQPSQFSSNWYGSRPKGAGLQMEHRKTARGFCEFGLLPTVFCPECRGRPCELAGVEPWGRPQTRDAYLPPHGGCVIIRSLPEGVRRARVFWELSYDPLVPAFITCGLALVWGYYSMRRNRMLHAFIGGLGSFIFILGIFFWWINRQFRNVIPGFIPFGRLITSLSMAALAFSTAARQVLMTWVPTDFADLRGWLDIRDPIYNMPIGWIGAGVGVVAILFSISVGANASMNYFASPPDPEGPVAFSISADGRRVDDLPPDPWQQLALGNFLWIAGVAMLLSSTHLDAVSSAILAFALSISSFLHLVNQWWMAMSTKKPSSFRQLLTQQEYDATTASRTKAAVAQLQDLLRLNPGLMNKVREESELRLRRFSAGGVHFQPPPEQMFDTRKSSCALL